MLLSSWPQFFLSWVQPVLPFGRFSSICPLKASFHWGEINCVHMALLISSRETPKPPKAELGKAKVSVQRPPSVSHSKEPTKEAEAHTRSSK